MNAYPQQIDNLRAIANKEQEFFAAVCLLTLISPTRAEARSQERNTGLVEQAIDRAPRWSIKKLTATYLTLGLSEIAKAVGIKSEEEVRKVVLDMVSPTRLHLPVCRNTI